MACKSCGKKYKSGEKKVNTTQTKTSSKPVQMAGVSSVFEHIKVEGNKVNPIEHSSIKKTKGIYVIGNFKGCGSCKYVLTQIERAVDKSILEKINLYYIDKNDSDMTQVEYIGNPTTYLIDSGKVIAQYNGIVANIKEIIKSFSEGNNLPKISVPTMKTHTSNTIEQSHIHEVFTLSPVKDKLLKDLYYEFLETKKDVLKDVSSISTFIDPVTNDLVITFDHKAKPLPTNKVESFIILH